MGKVNGCLRVSFIIFNVVYAILGCVLVFGTVAVIGYSHQVEGIGIPSLRWILVFSISVLGIPCLGIYVGCTEKLLPLKIFAGFLAVAMVIMLILGMVVVLGKNKIVEPFQAHSSDMPQRIMENQSFREFVEELQLEAHCCGVNSPEDWGSRIPESCDCTYATEGFAPIGLGTSGCKARPHGTDGPEQIYPRPCDTIILAIIDIFVRVAMGFFFGFAAVELLGLLLSYLMIRQVKGHNGSGGVGEPIEGQYL